MAATLKTIALDDFSSLKASMASACDDAVLVAKFAGIYRQGSGGNGDGLFMTATIAAHFAILEPACLILDLRDLQYKWGNTILKAINFFYEFGRDDDEKGKAVIIVARDEVHEALAGLERTLKAGKRIYCKNFEEALSVAEQQAKAYFQ